MTSWILSTSKDWEAVTSLSNSFQCYYRSHSKKAFPCVQLEFCMFYTCGLLSFNLIPLRRIWFHILYSHPFSICTQPSYLRLLTTKHIQLSLPLLMWGMLQFLNGLHGPLLDSVQYVHILLVHREPRAGHSAWGVASSHLFCKAISQLTSPLMYIGAVWCYCVFWYCCFMSNSVHPYFKWTFKVLASPFQDDMRENLKVGFCHK